MKTKTTFLAIILLLLFFQEATAQQSEFIQTQPFQDLIGTVDFIDLNPTTPQLEVIVGGNEGSGVGQSICYAFNGGDWSIDRNFNPGTGQRGQLISFDFDQNSQKDISILSQYGFTVFRNDGDGIFENIEFSNPDTYFQAGMSEIDIDGDEDDDIYITGNINPNGVNIQDAYLRNNEDGTFSYIVGTPIQNPMADCAIASADMNNDGIKDLVRNGLINGGANAYASVSVNNGNGTFTEHPLSLGLVLIQV